jgi:Uma2 family endonuclease
VYWLDVCLLPWHALNSPAHRPADWTSQPPPQLAIEVTEPATAAFDRTERRRAYAQGGCPRLLLVDPADPERSHPETTFELWDLTTPTDTPTRKATDRIHLDSPASITIDLRTLSEFTRHVIDAQHANEL